MQYFICSFCNKRRAQNNMMHNFRCWMCNGDQYSKEIKVCRKCGLRLYRKDESLDESLLSVCVSFHQKEFHSSVNIT